MFQLVQKGLRAEKKKRKELEEPFIDDRDESSAEIADYKSELLAVIRSRHQTDLNAYVRGFFVNQVFRRSSLPEKLAMAALTELGCYKSIHSSVLTFYFNANVTRDQLLPLRFAIFEELWPVARTKVL